MPTREQVAVPPQHRIGVHQQPHLAQHATRETVQQRGQERPVARANRALSLTSWRSSTMS
ncbi:hypothetical protein ACIQB5_31850 [Streptomyces sp. NPDC088560]|uniref:hypothetical protein n=1 Tax=Streptomyces sp. NPDC088560 TaxID=3365868 RepID=UPI00382B84A7